MIRIGTQAGNAICTRNGYMYRILILNHGLLDYDAARWVESDSGVYEPFKLGKNGPNAFNRMASLTEAWTIRDQILFLQQIADQMTKCGTRDANVTRWIQDQIAEENLVLQNL